MTFSGALVALPFGPPWSPKLQCNPPTRGCKLHCCMEEGLTPRTAAVVAMRTAEDAAVTAVGGGATSPAASIAATASLCARTAVHVSKGRKRSPLAAGLDDSDASPWQEPPPDALEQCLREAPEEPPEEPPQEPPEEDDLEQYSQEAFEEPPPEVDIEQCMREARRQRASGGV